MKSGSTVRTICPYCGVGCTLVLHLQGDYIVKVASDYASPVNHGNLCVKGRFGMEFVNHPDRLRTPLIRRNGELTPATWDEALDWIVDRFATIARESGPDALGFLASAKCTNEENYLFQKLARSVVGTHNVDHCARL
ncbi:MAG: molybdopterin-dependent oxidoreductase [Chloroflexi bacterium]|nr:molybdopterin-dependent oxidoreductase [Chloroflexota bacterium]MBI3761906.1 molybdopterin-dependent oxidoreductase [Chloroflexota bacterium]